MVKVILEVSGLGSNDSVSILLVILLSYTIVEQTDLTRFRIECLKPS
jgi:hypothetical protein